MTTQAGASTPVQTSPSSCPADAAVLRPWLLARAPLPPAPPLTEFIAFLAGMIAMVAIHVLTGWLLRVPQVPRPYAPHAARHAALDDAAPLGPPSAERMAALDFYVVPSDIEALGDVALGDMGTLDMGDMANRPSPMPHAPAQSDMPDSPLAADDTQRRARLAERLAEREG